MRSFLALLTLLYLLSAPCSAAAADLALTASEQQWLQDHPVVRARISPTYPPFEFYENDSFHGMAYDYVQLIAKRLGIRIEPVVGLTWKESLEQLKSRSGVDLVIMITKDKSREEFIEFTRNYISFPEVIFTRKDSRFIAGIKDLSGATVATENGFIESDYLKRDIPQVRILETSTTGKALELVATGKADAYVGNLAVASYLIEKSGFTDLKVAAPSSYPDDAYAMGVRKDWPQLAAMIDKTLASMSDEEHRQIRQKWLSLRYEHGLRLLDLIKWVALVAGILIIFIVQLKRMVKQRTKELQSSLCQLEKTHHKLEDTLHQLEDIIEFLPDATFVLDDKGRIIAWNRAIEEMTGIAKSEMIGKGELSHSIPFYGAPRPALADLLLSGQEPAAGQYGVFHQSGKILAACGSTPALYGGQGAYLSVTASPLTDSSGNLIGAIESLRDITSMRKAEAEVRALNEQLETRVQLRTSELELAKSELRTMNDNLTRHSMALEEANSKLEAFAYSVSHDLQAPLRHISSYAALVVEEHSGRMEAEGRHYLQRITFKCQQMNEMISGMLAFAMASNGELNKVPVDPNRLLDELLSELQPGNTKIVRQQLPSCQADPILLKQVYANLLGNALKFSRMKDEAATIEIGSDCRDGQTVYFVRDNGIGFDMAYAERLFDVFQRLQAGDNFEGIGIGLAIVQSIIKRHGGNIRAEGIPGEGATFYFTLAE